MSPSTLSLFPSPDASLPRKPSFRRAKNEHASSDNGELHLRGVAFQVVTSQRKTATVQPASDTIEHTYFCDPVPSGVIAIEPDTAPSFTAGSNTSPARSSVPRRQSRTRRKSGPLTMELPIMEDIDADDVREDDHLPELPRNAAFRANTPPRRTLSTGSRSKAPPKLSTIVQPDRPNAPVTPVDEKRDRLSPLPVKRTFSPTSADFPSEGPPSYRTGSPASLKTCQGAESYYTTPMRSMFPTYDPSKPLHRQNYYPSPSASPPPAYLGDNVSKIGSPAERQEIQRFNSTVGMLDGYEHVPTAAHGDMQALWQASCDECPAAGRKVRFGLYQPQSNSKALTIGTSSEDVLFAMERDISSAQSGASSKQFDIRKHDPTSRTSCSVATLVLPDPTRNPKAAKKSIIDDDITIFPHTAAMYALETVSDPEAAQDAITEAHRRYCCDLIKRTRKRDSLGAVTAYYDLKHPMLGTCPITVTKSSSPGSISGPRAKISFHHPSATPAAVMADTLNLAFIDFAHDACVLDLPGLMALDSRFVVDTVVSALLAVAVVESDKLVAESLCFEAPPKTPLNGKSKKQRRRASVASKKSKKDGGDVKLAIDEQVELGGVAKGVLTVMEIGFKASAWVIITGVKVGFGVVEYGIEKIGKRI